jgi:hypothetical protein
MQLAYLSQIGQSYIAEVGTSGLRNNFAKAWIGIQDRLKGKITALRNLEAAGTAASPAPQVHGGPKSVKALAQFHQAQQERAGKTGDQSDANRLRAEILRIQLWLQMEGASADDDGNVNMGALQDLKVYYDTDLAKQGMTQVTINGGFLSLGRSPLDTSKMVTHFSGPGKGIYALSSTGNLHVGSHVVGHYHHSSLLAGSNVACAGEMEVRGGRLVWLSNKSGHYLPSYNHLLQILHLLQKKGVDMSFRILAFAGGDQKSYPSVADFLSDLTDNNQPDYELNKLLAYSDHLRPSILRSNGWRWAKGKENQGVYVIATNASVPHKVVREWCKSQGKTLTISTQAGANR